MINSETISHINLTAPIPQGGNTVTIIGIGLILSTSGKHWNYD